MKKKIIYPITTIVIIIAAWQIVVECAEIPAYILPPPLSVAAAFVDDFSSIASNGISTLAEGFIGMAIAVAISIVVAFLMDKFDRFKKTVYPLLVITQTVPVIAIAPLLIIWFGFGMLPKVILVVIMCFFPITVNLVDGFDCVDKDSLNMFRVLRASESQIYYHLKFPAALPYFFSGLKISITWMLMSAILSEWIGSKSGIGVYMLRAKQSYSLDKLFASVVFVVVISLILIGIVNLVRNKVIRWR